MTLSKALENYERLLSKRATPQELATGLKELRERTNLMNIAYYPLCDNDSEDPYP